MIPSPPSPILHRLGALALILVGLWASGGLAQERTRTLTELRRARNEAMARHHETVQELVALDRELRTVEKDLQEKNAAVRRAEALGGPFRAQTVQTLRAEARKVAEAKVKLAMRHTALTPRIELQRVREIEARSAYANRLMEVAHRLMDQPEPNRRTQNIREKTEMALDELSAIAKLRKNSKSGSDLRPPVKPLGPYASREDMEWRAKAYERQIKAFQSQSRELEPREKRILEHVEHLDRLTRRGYALPELSATLKREREELTQVQDLRQAIERQTRYYRQLLVGLRDRIDRSRSGEKP